MQARPRLPLLLTCHQIYCETVEISLSLSTFMFSSLSVLPGCKTLPANLRTKIQYVRFHASVTVTGGTVRFMDTLRERGVGLRDLLPNVKCIEYNVAAGDLDAEEFQRSYYNGPSWLDVVEDCFLKTGCRIEASYCPGRLAGMRFDTSARNNFDPLQCIATAFALPNIRAHGRQKSDLCPG
ncbi:hypothetical protein DE146DRAFT_370234 [Phaeosphaeria sp. MPI-PUGE-AT-0046c]|nr:hypothetical protein DE146DRAFT_370234 [Phaeosphaeria sp. MPI-PUGE-AT-0046c]